MLDRGDKVLMPTVGVTIDIKFVGNRKVELEFHAPESVAIHSVFKDSSKMFKNLRNEG